jgi:hypothetical protein
MKRFIVRIAIPLAGLLLVALPGPLAAQEADQGSLSGEIVIGYRNVDVSGADRKFMEDINLEDGPRLFDFSVDFTPADGLRDAVDRLRLDVHNLGGDPFETIDLDVQRFGRYDFSYQRRTSEYFYEDLILPADQATVSLSNVGDLHHLDFERVHDRASLDLDLTRAATLSFGFDRYTKLGTGSTTLDIQRDEFELERVIDESMDQYQAGFQYAWDRVTLVLEETVRDYDNAVEIFLPGASPGENTGNAASLSFFFLDQPYDYTSQQHTVRVLARPNDRLDVMVSAILQNLDLDVEADETSGGIGFNGQPFTTDDSGAGEIDRDLGLYQLDLTYRINDRVALIGNVRQQELDQQGDFEFAGALNLGAWDISTTGAELGVEVALTPTVTLAGGVAQESRDITFGHNEGDGPAGFEDESETTERTGLFVNLGWRPAAGTEVVASIEDNSFDDPFTLASPTDRRRYRLRGRYRWDNGLGVSGSYAKTEVDNDNSGWSADTDQIGVRLDYQHQALSLSVGYSNIDLERQIDQTVAGLGRTLAIFYGADSDFFDGRVRYQATERFAVGGDLRLYQNDGSFGLERDDYRAFVEVGFADAYTARLAYRTVDYSEDAVDFDDYDAEILEAAIGYRW